MKHSLLFLLIFSMVTFRGMAQTTVSGMVRDEMGKPLPFATIALIHARDSSLIIGMATDERGAFAFENVKTGHYIIRASNVGSNKNYSAPLEIGSDPVNVPPLTLSNVANNLAEMQVTAKKPFVEQRIDRMVVNVANSIVGSGSTALEVLEKSPGVSIDYQNDRLQLRGKDGVIVQIDGKQTYLSPQDVIALLRTMSSDNIESIELITNPSARYDAAGNSGIINIVLKKNSNVGTNGTASIAGGTGKLDRERGSLQLNHRTQKMNLFSNYSLNRGGNYWDFRFQRNQADPSAEDASRRSLGKQFTHLNFRDLGQNAKAGIDFSPNKNTTIGLVWTGIWSEHQEKGPAGATFRRTADGPIYLQTETYKTFDVVSQNQVGNVNFQHSFGGKGKAHRAGQLNADFDLGHFSRRYRNNLLTKLIQTNHEVDSPAGQLLITQPSTVDIGTVKIDYNQALSDNWKLEAGLKSASVKTDNDLQFSSGQPGMLVKDPELSNRFQYTERVNAGYVSLSGKWGHRPDRKIEFQAGLRAENTHSEGRSVTLDQVVVRNYLKWFPSLFLSRPLSSKQTLTFSYSHRIDRPNYQNLNPARGYVDPFAYMIGNAYLKPQFTHALEGKWAFKKGLFTSLAANYTKDLMFFTIHALDGNKTYVTLENLGRSQGYTFTVGWPMTVAKGWQLQTSLLGYFNRFQYEYEGSLLRIENVAGRLNANNAFTLGHGWTAELSGWASTPAMNGIWHAAWMGSLDAGIQKVISPVFRVKCSVQDMLHTNRFSATTNVLSYSGNTRLSFDTRIVLLNLTYSFGNQKLRGARDRKTGSDEESRRAN